jgi:hypothetical protein
MKLLVTNSLTTLLSSVFIVGIATAFLFTSS